MAASAAASGLEASVSSLNSLDNDTSANSSANIGTQQSKASSANTSVTPSPLASREPSPTRPAAKPVRHNRVPTGGSSRSRKNSFQEPSPSRSRSGNHPASARSSITSASTPALAPPSNGGPVVRAPIPQKPPLVSESSKDSPRWPVSPRLKSPPPTLSNRPANLPTSRKNDAEPPMLTIQRASPSPAPDATASDPESDDAPAPSGVRTPSRGPSNGSSTLETVQEVSQPNTPGPVSSLDTALESLAKSSDALEASTADGYGQGGEPGSQQTSTSVESGSDSGSQKTEKTRSVSVAPPSLHSRQSSSTLKLGGKGPSGEGSGHMTVEEEKVTGLPQMTLKPSERTQGNGGTLRTKPSTETIKPKKEKKKHPRKPTPAAGTVSSKADIFEAKVASAVEENDSSDSDETFVYDSNPPDAGDRPRRYHHSRTPSATSMASQADRNGLRALHNMMDGNSTIIAPKKNMKFVNTYNSSGPDSPLLLDDEGRGTRGSTTSTARASSRHHHHVGRWLRNNGNHTSLFDNDSPYPTSTRTKFSSSVPRQSSNPPSPRFPINQNGNGNGSTNGNNLAPSSKNTSALNSNSHTLNPNSNGGRGWSSQAKRLPRVGSIYNMDDTPGADDEHTPLLLSGAVRSARSRGNRRTAGSGRNLEAQSYRQRPTFLNRFASCLVLTIMLLLVITGAIGFMFATSQPLMNLEIVKIENVLASEQELMMDIQVRAHNPNVVVVMVDSANLEVFAKSPHAGKDSEWWREPVEPNYGDLEVSGGGKVKQPAKPPSDETDPNMRLGNIHRFDSPLTFEGSFFRSGISTSSGELRLSRPGNSTDRGSERWERILQHNFTLIIQGTLNYQLPLSSKQRSVIVSGSAKVLPNSADEPVTSPNGTDVGIFR